MVDTYNKFATAQAFTGSDEIGEDVIDLKAAGNDFSVGSDLFVVAVHVTTAAKVSDANETYEFQVLNDDAAACTSATVVASRTIDKALLVANSVHYVPIPPGSISLQYLGIKGVLGGTNPAVSLTSYLIPASAVQADKYYADNSTIN